MASVDTCSTEISRLPRSSSGGLSPAQPVGESRADLGREVEEARVTGKLLQALVYEVAGAVHVAAPVGQYT
jgi:hypothetical protein